MKSKKRWTLPCFKFEYRSFTKVFYWLYKCMLYCLGLIDSIAHNYKQQVSLPSQTYPDPILLSHRSSLDALGSQYISILNWRGRPGGWHLSKVHHHICVPSKVPSKKAAPLRKSWILQPSPPFPHRSQLTFIIWIPCCLKSSCSPFETNLETIWLPSETNLGTRRPVLSCVTSMLWMPTCLFPHALHKFPARDSLNWPLHRIYNNGQPC